MKRLLLGLLLGVLVLFVSVVAIVSVRVSDVAPLPPPDPALAIELSDGTSLPLAEVVERAGRGLPQPLPQPPALPLKAGEAPPSPAVAAALDQARRTDGVTIVSGDRDDPDAFLLALADEARHAGRSEQALALYLSVPAGSEHYARARRRAAWDVLTRDMDEPEQAVRYANQSLHADPLDGNVWQDWWRVQASVLGLPVD